MNIIKVINIKCGGCEKSIISALKKKGLSDIKVDVENQTVEFTGDYDVARAKLTKMGYPEAGSKEAGSIAKKAKSYISCMIGRGKKLKKQ